MIDNGFSVDFSKELAAGDKIVNSISMGSKLIILGETSIAELDHVNTQDATKRSVLAFGSRNYIVARAFYQWLHILGFIPISEDAKEQVKEILFKIMKELVSSYLIAERFKNEVDESEKKWKGEAPSNKRVRSIPSTPGLETRVTSFLSHSKKSIKLFSELFFPLLGVEYPKDRGDYQLISDPNAFKKLKENVKDEDSLCKFLEEVGNDNSQLNRIVNLRNRDEHDHSSKGRLKILDYRMVNNILHAPCWMLKDEQEYSIAKDMIEIPRVILEHLECFIYLILVSYLENKSLWLKEITEHQRNAKCPIRFEIQLIKP